MCGFLYVLCCKNCSYTDWDLYPISTGFPISPISHHNEVRHKEQKMTATLCWDNVAVCLTMSRSHKGDMWRFSTGDFFQEGHYVKYGGRRSWFWCDWNNPIWKTFLLKICSSKMSMNWTRIIQLSKAAQICKLSGLKQNKKTLILLSSVKRNLT